jgi:hypothetical protein
MKFENPTESIEYNAAELIKYYEHMGDSLEETDARELRRIEDLRLHRVATWDDEVRAHRIRRRQVDRAFDIREAERASHGERTDAE